MIVRRHSSDRRDAAEACFRGFRRGVPLPILAVMNYVLALFLPPLSILLVGRPITAIVTFLIWIPAIIFSGGLTHPMFVVLAWILIYQSHADRRERGRY